LFCLKSIFVVLYNWQRKRKLAILSELIFFHWSGLLWLLLAIASGLLSFALVALIKQRFSQQLLDLPNDRSSHTQPTPRGGGLGFAIAFAIASLGAAITVRYFPAALSPGTSLTSFQVAILACWVVLAPLALVGFLDDRWGLPAGVRYLVQLAVAGVACFFFGPFPQPWLTGWGLPGQAIAIAIALIGFTALVNFYNFMDGLDGLVAGVTAVQLGFLALFLHQPLFWLLVAALLGFLCWNWSPAKIFMGDAGSTVLGAAVAISLLSSPVSTSQTWAALAITLPLTADATYTLILRLSRGENIFQAHRKHLFQRLQQSGWSHAQVALTYISITAIFALSISFWGTLGAGLSVLAAAIAIGLAEVYLRLGIRN